MTTEAWQAITADQLRTIKSHHDQAKLKSAYRETGTGVLAIYDVADAREMDQLIAAMPMVRDFAEISVKAMWDMAPVLEGIQD